MNKKIVSAFSAALLSAAVFSACGSPTAKNKAASSSSSKAGSKPSASETGSPSASSSSSSSFPNPDNDPLYQKAYADYAANKYDAAIAICNDALSTNKDCFWAYNLKGISVYFSNGNSAAKSCLELIDKSIAINPNYSYGYFNKGLIQKGLKEWDEAVSDFNKVLELKPGDTWSYYGIATVYADSGKNDLALQYLKLAIDTDPTGVKAQIHDDMQRHFSKLKDNPAFQNLIK